MFSSEKINLLLQLSDKDFLSNKLAAIAKIEILVSLKNSHL
jgi:hypothetical protein